LESEQEVVRLKKKLSQYIQQSNESVKAYKDQLAERDKEAASKNEQI
jgi:ElaB/YqjD/DUF883 family membrane-anchored ribosome-binding protein